MTRKRYGFSGRVKIGKKILWSEPVIQARQLTLEG